MALRERYEEVVRPELCKRFSYGNAMQAPRPLKVCINMGVQGARQDPKVLEAAMNELAAITGQQPARRRAKRSIAAFGIRQGDPIGCVVTLRGRRMYEFLERLFNVALPRIRDFRGLAPSSFDGRGNYSFGVREQLIFPELGYDDVESVRGMDITIATSAKTDEEAAALLQLMGMPLVTE
ncbi:MAG: 50S ribosomal protein L5 [Armatimonadota bacterium]